MNQHLGRTYSAATSAESYLLIAGGLNRQRKPSSDLFIYDSQKNIWYKSNLSSPRYSLSAASYGSIAAFAGGRSYKIDDTVDILDMKSLTSKRLHLSSPRASLAATAGNKKILFAGGGENQNETTATVDILDLSTLTWKISNLSQARLNLSAASTDCYAIFAGGLSGQTTYDVVDIYNYQTEIWTTTTLSKPRHGLAAAATLTTAAFAGGISENACSAIVDIFDAKSCSWKTANLSVPRAYLTATSFNELLIFAGGYTFKEDGTTAISDIIDIYNTSTHSWTTDKLSEARHGLSSCSSHDKVIFIGGSSLNDGSSLYSDTIDFFNPKTQKLFTKNLSDIKFSNKQLIFIPSENYIKSERIRGKQVEILSQKSISDLQHEIILHLISKSTTTDKLKNIPNRIKNSSEITIPSISFEFKKLSCDLQTRLEELAIALNENKEFRFIEDGESQTSDISLITSIIQGIRYAFYSACFCGGELPSTPLLYSFLDQHTDQIISWNATEKSTVNLIVQILPFVQIDTDFNLDSWQLFKPNDQWLACIAQNHIARDLIISLKHSLWFKKEISLVEVNESKILVNCNNLYMSLCLGLESQYIIDDVMLENIPWRFAPDRPFLPSLNLPHDRLGYLSASQVQFWASIKSSGIPYQPISDTQLNLCDFWYDLLKTNPSSLFSFSRIQSGLWQIASAMGLPFFKAEPIALNGIYDCLAGLDGFISECKEIGGGGFPVNVKKIFVDYWSSIWDIRKQAHNHDTLLDKIKNPSEALKELYALRSSIVHSDRIELDSNIRKTKILLGDWFNPGQFTASSLAFCIAPIVKDLIKVFITEKNLLSDLMNGRKENVLLAFDKVHSTDKRI